MPTGDAGFELGFEGGDPSSHRGDTGRDDIAPRAVGQQGVHAGRTSELGIDRIELLARPRATAR